MISISKDEAKASLSFAAKKVSGTLPPSITVGSASIPTAAILQVVSLLVEELIDNVYERQVNIEAGEDAEITVRIED